MNRDDPVVVHYLQMSLLGSLIDPYQNERDTTKNASEEDKELAWKRLSEHFGTPIV